MTTQKICDSPGPDSLWTLSFAGMFLANFMMMFSFYLLMPTLPFYLVDQLGVETSVAGVALSAYILAAVLVRPFSGYFIDRLPRKRLYLIFYVAFILLFPGYLIPAGLWFFITLRVLHGFIWGAIIPSSNTLALDIMPAVRRGEGIGYYGLSSNISMALGPMAGLFLYEAFDFKVIFLSAMATSVTGFLIALTVKPPQKPLQPAKTPLSLDRFLLVKAIPVGINLILGSVSYGAVCTYAAMYGKQIGIGNTGLFFVWLALGVILSRIVGGRYIDRGKIHLLSVFSFAILAVSLALFSLVSLSWVYLMMAFFLGIGYGLLFPSIQALIINLAPHSQRGTANATHFTAVDIGIGSGILIGGKIAQVFGLSVVFLGASLLCFLGVVYYLRISAPHYRKYRLR